MAGDTSNVGACENNSESFAKLFTRAVSATVQSECRVADGPFTGVVRRFAYVTSGIEPNRTRLPIRPIADLAVRHQLGRWPEPILNAIGRVSPWTDL